MYRNRGQTRFRLIGAALRSHAPAQAAVHSLTQHCVEYRADRNGADAAQYAGYVAAHQDCAEHDHARQADGLADDFGVNQISLYLLQYQKYYYE